MTRLRQVAGCIADVRGEGRAVLDYTARQTLARTFDGHDPDQPAAGHYRMRLRSGGVYVGIRIWHGAPLDPLTGEEMDRSHRWQAVANDRPIDLARVWPKCAGETITPEEYAYLAAQQRWGEANAPDSPQAQPTRRINPLTSPTPF